MANADYGGRGAESLTIYSNDGRNMNTEIRNYTNLPWHQRRTLRKQLATIGSPIRRAAIAWLNEQYQKYRQAGGELIALAWAREILPGDLWNCLFAANARMGSYAVPAVLLEKDGGRYRVCKQRRK
jgi:hypothetical protein